MEKMPNKKINNFFKKIAVFAVFLVFTSGCQNESSKISVELPGKNPFPSTYKATKHQPFLIHNVNVLTGEGDLRMDTSVLVENGKISQIGNIIDPPSGTLEFSVAGKWLTPGLIDVHSHLGVYPSPSVESHSDGNEMTKPVTGEVWAEHSVWPQDPQFEKALAGGITTAQILPGSGNLIGGRGVTLKNVASVSVQGMKFPGAPYSLKMACGENPKRFYGGQGKSPATRMGNMAGYRTAWIKAQDYQLKWQDYIKKAEAGDPKAKRPMRDLNLETLVGVLEGDIRIHNHCYRADEMVQMIDLSKEFGYQISAFHHSVEAYKVAPILAKENICAVMWADWWGFKQEAFDSVRENMALVDMVGGCAVIHSDDPIQVQRLNQEIAKAMSAGNRMGLDIKPEHAIQWATLNAAKALGIETQTGSIKVGKNADLVLWDMDPFSIYAHAEKVWIDGVQQYDRNSSIGRETSDFNLGILSAQGDRP